MKEQNKKSQYLKRVWIDSTENDKTWMVLTKKKYLTDILLIFEKLLVVMTSQQNDGKTFFLQSCWVRKHFRTPFNVENKALIATNRNPKKPSV